jgi:Protein of unknown function (DUF1604)
MSRAVDDYTVPSPVASLQATSTPLVQKKVRPPHCLRHTYQLFLKGWTPSTFVSSRSERAKQKAARPEDFMDEEDLAELRESQIMTGIKEQQQRDVFAGTQAGPTAQQDDPEQE